MIVSAPSGKIFRWHCNTLLKTNTYLSSHRSGVDRFVDWCDSHRLQINTVKTVEMLVDPRSIGERSSVTIHGRNTEQANSFKYMGVHIDNDLSLLMQVACIRAQIHQRIHFLHRLRVFGVCRNIMLIFNRATIESVLQYRVTSWFGNLTVKANRQYFSGLISRIALNMFFSISGEGTGFLFVNITDTHSFLPLSVKLINERIAQDGQKRYRSCIPETLWLWVQRQHLVGGKHYKCVIWWNGPEGRGTLQTMSVCTEPCRWLKNRL